MTDLTKPKTKSERIKELLLAGWSPEAVAKELDTTREYVYKEKGKFKRQKLLVTQQSLTIANGHNEVTVIKGQPVDNLNNSLPLQEDQSSGNSEYNIPPLERNDLKTIYSCFENNMDASEVVANHGIRPDISEREYNRFLFLKSRDPMEFQNILISGIMTSPPEIQSLIDKARRGTLLTNSELVSIINFNMEVYGSQLLSDAVSNPKIPPPGLNRFVCRFCHLSQPGVLFDVRSYSGKFLQDMSSGHVCPVCIRIKDEAYEQFKLHPADH
jgi:hypothetical protein